MTGFALGALVLVALAWTLLLPALRQARRPRPSAAVADGAAVRAVWREQLDALDAELAAGQLDAAQHRAGRAELERRVLEEAMPVEASQATRPAVEVAHPARGRIDVAPAAHRTGSSAAAPAVGRDHRAARGPVVGALLFCAGAVGLYALIGNPAALVAPAASGAEASAADVAPQDVAAMVDALAVRLEARPAGDKADLDGWVMLARAYGGLGRFDDADRAYARAIGLAPDDAQLLADRADVVAMRQGQRTDGEPARLIEAALRLDPANPKALALAGSAAFERRDYAAAIVHWQAARARAAPGSAFATGLDQSLVAARAANGEIAADATLGPAATGAATGSIAARPGSTQATTAKPLATATATATATTAAATAAAMTAETAAAPAPTTITPTATPSVTVPARAGRIDGQVRIAAALASRLAPDDTVFVFARAADGPRVPLAIVKRRASELPFAFTLDDAMAMAPGLRLSGFDRVVVGARVSRSGDAMPQPGDLIGSVDARTDGAAVSVTLDRVQP